MLIRTIALGLLLSVLNACTGKNLYVAHDTVIGVNGALNSNNGSGHLLVGYDRNFLGVIPKKTDGEVMAVRSCSKLVVTGIKLTLFREHLATGEAAINHPGLKCEDVAEDVK